MRCDAFWAGWAVSRPPVNWPGWAPLDRVLDRFRQVLAAGDEDEAGRLLDAAEVLEAALVVTFEKGGS